MSSNKKARLRIVVDEREKRSMVPDALKELGANVEYAVLDVGDYLVYGNCCIERKSVDDLINSIYDARLFIQVDEMLKHYSRSVVIVEGSSEDIEGMDKPNVLYSALASLAVEYRVPVVYTPSYLHTALAIVALAKHCSSKEDAYREPLLKRIRKSKDGLLREQQLSIIASLPGIGSRLASRLLERFGSPINIFNASTADLARVEGIGYAKARKIRYALDTSISSKFTRHNLLDDYTDATDVRNG
ncbi:DNA integrity scanning protein DisA [archaeon HR05]|nr:DNA integrity scanning protein DisA [archaeon HR05]